MITNEGAEHSWQQQNVVTPRAWPGHPDTCRAVAADLSHTLHGLVTALGNEDQVITELSLDWPLNLADLAGGEHHVIELLDHLRCSTASQRTAFYTNQRIVCTMRLLDIKTWPGPNSPREPPDLPEGHVECSLASSVNLAITSLDASIAALSSRHLASSLTVGARQSMHRAAHARAFDSVRTEDVVGRCRDSGGRADERGQAERKEDKRLGLLLAKTHVPLPSGRAYAQHRAPDARARHHL